MSSNLSDPKTPQLYVETPARNQESPPWAKHTLARHMPFALVFLLAIILLTINVASPWHSIHEDNGLGIENAAINHIRFGLNFTKGQDYLDTSIQPPVYLADGIEPQGVASAQEFQYFRTATVEPRLYGHHPPLLGLTVAVSLLTFGYHFWAVRLVPIVFTLLALLAFYRLMTLLFETRTATFASALFITFPIAAYYGRDVAHEAPTLCCELGMALCYVLYRRSGRDGWLAGLAACVVAGVAFDWPMVYFAWILFALDAVSSRHGRWRVALVTVGASTLMFALVVLQIAWADNWSLSTLRDGFLMRTAAEPALAWLKEILRHNLLDFGLWTWLTVPFGVLFLWRRYQRGGMAPLRHVRWRLRRSGLPLRGRIIALFALGGLAHILLFRDGAFVHDYWQFYLIPFYGSVLGWGGVLLSRHLAAHPIMLRGRLSAISCATRQNLLLITFVMLALAMSAPVISYLYTTNSLL